MNNNNLKDMDDLDDLDGFKMLHLQASHVKEELDGMLAAQEITESDYNKNIVSLAYEYALNGFPDDCLEMLINVKENYFSASVLSHFSEDPAYFAKVNLIFEILTYVNKVPYDIITDMIATQPKGSA